MNSILKKAKKQINGAKEDFSLTNHDIAVIGIDGYFPQATNLAEFWEVLISSKNCLSEIPPFRKYDAEECVPFLVPKKEEDPQYRKMNYLDRIDLFDYNFFSLSKRECELMDPAHKMVLEIVWKCIESAGYGARIFGTKTGVFVGYSDEPYYMQVLSKLNSPTVMPTATDFVRSAIAGRVSYLLNLKGPSLVIDTACSSSLVAVHQACQALRNGECEMAIVASAKAVLLPLQSAKSDKTESIDGMTYSFDERANGMGVGEGAAAVLLKPLSAANNDGDYIYAVIRGSAVNQDGKTNGFTSPSPSAQADVIVNAWRDAQINPSDVSYIEAHGSATALGDPIEIQGVTEAFERFTTKRQFCAIGSVKANIGHLDHAAGLAGLIKVILMLNHKKIPPQKNFKYPNRRIPFHRSPVFVNDSFVSWNSPNKLRICGVNSFGLTGTNCHVVVCEAEKQEFANSNLTPYLFTLTAHSRQAMRYQLNSIYSFISSCLSLPICNLCYTSNVSKRPDKYRVAFIVNSVPELLQAMYDYHKNEITQKNKGIYVSETEDETEELALDQIESKQDTCRLIMLHQLAENFVKCHSVNLLEQFAFQPKILPIPSDPFVKECCWIHPSDIEQRQDNNLVHTIKWEKSPLVIGEANGRNKFNNEILIIGDDSLISGIDQEHAMIYNARFAETYTKIDKTHYTIDGTFQGFQQLFKEIELSNSITNLIYLPPSNMVSIDSLETLNGQYNKCVNCFIMLYQALRQQASIKQLNFYCIAQHVNQIVPNDVSVSPMNAALFAMIQAVEVEDFDMRCKCIDIGDIISFSELQRECNSQQTSVKVAYRGGIRYLPFITPSKKHNETTLPVKDGGVYVITGGVGGIGLSIASQLAQEHIITLVLLGRRDRSTVYTGEILYNEVLLRVKEIEDRGSKVVYYRADVTDKDSLKDALNAIRAQFGKIDGIIHSAGVNVGVSGKLLKNADAKKIRCDIAVKIHGTVLLDLLTRVDKLDMFVLVTSPITWIGGSGISDYMASNAFESNYAVYRNSIGLTTKAIGWAPWPHSINTKDEVYVEERQLFRVLTKEDINLGLKLAFHMSDIECTVGRLNLSASIKLLDGILFHLSPDILSSDTPINERETKFLLNVSCEITGRDDFQYTQTEREVAQAWGITLGLNKVDINDNFFENGGHSILAIKLEVELSERIEYTDVYRYPTVASLAAFIDEKERDDNNEL